jgi:hypothetical protein
LKDSVPNDFYKLDDSDFLAFAKSFKAIEPSIHKKTKADILSTDASDIKIVKTYYNLLANSDYRTAFSSLVNPSQTQSEFISSQNNIYDQKITNINQISEHEVEVFLDVQLHNQAIEKYRYVFDIINNKLQQTLDELINGEISTFGKMRAYASDRGLQSIVVLQNDGKEKIIDMEQYVKDSEWHPTFYSPHFSRSGRYILYGIVYYEGGSSNVYDIVNNKIFTDIPVGEFNSEETLYFTCQYSESYGPTEAIIYSVPEFSVKVDLLKLHPELSKYWNYDCSEDEKTHTETFEFSGSYEGTAFSTTTKEVYRFDSRTGEPL